MSFFPRSFIHEAAPASSFHPLFRLLDDFDNYRTTTNNTNSSPSHHHQSASLFNMKSFTPKFDVREVGEVYELHGDLPGIAQKDIEIEFTDENTLTIKGRTERAYESGSSSSAALENGKQPAALEHHEDKEHQPTVEDEAEDSNASTSQEVTKATPTPLEVAEKPAEPQPKYWVSERSVGEFSRSFTFPVRVDQEAVKASMKNGVLAIVVPKARKSEARKITIQ